MITKDALLAAAKASAAENSSRPLTSACMGAIAADLAGSPAWWTTIEPYWRRRQFADGDQALHLVWAAMHFEALDGHPLGRELPSCQGKPGDLPGAVRRFLATPPARFLQSLASRRAREYGPFWSARWLQPASQFFQRRDLAYFVVEVDSIGGLGAAADLLVGAKGFDSALVEARVALDSPPLDLRTDDAAKWLVACHMPDAVGEIRVTARGARRLRDELREDPTALQLADCAAELAPAFIAKNIPPSGGAGLLVFTNGLVRQLSSERAPAFLRDLKAVLTTWGDKALWVDVERPAEQPHVIEVRGWRPQGRVLQTRVLESFVFNGRAHQRFAPEDQNAPFLAV